MRITHQMISRGFLKRMDTNLTNLTRSNEKLASQRAFNKGHENLADAGRAMKLRKLIVDNERHQVTVRDAEGRAVAAEDGMRTVVDLLDRLTDRNIYGLNGTMAEDDREKLATEIEKAQEEVMQIMNSQFAGKFIYAASGNADGSAPFAADSAGRLTFNGSIVDNMVADAATGKLSTYDVSNGTYTPIPWNEENYIDIGYGYSMKNGKVDPSTGFLDTYSGPVSFGYGRNEDGVPLNAYNLMGDLVANLRTSPTDIRSIEKDLDAVPQTRAFLLTSITQVGARVTMLEDASERLETEYVNLVERQNELEGVDLSHEMIANKDFDMSWLVTLQLGSKILPQSIFDFLR